MLLQYEKSCHTELDSESAFVDSKSSSPMTMYFILLLALLNAESVSVANEKS